MKTVHLFAVSLAAAMALGAAGGYGLSQLTQQGASTQSEVSSDVSAPKQQGSSLTPPRAEDGPWSRDLKIVFGATLDSLGEATTFVERAGVPSVVQRQDGSLLAAFQWFPEDNDDAFDRVAVSSSTDGGATWSDPEPIVIEGLPDGYQRPFDPTLVVLEDGLVRLYFTSSTEEKPGPNQVTSIYAATSEDGVTYAYEDEVFAIDGERMYDAAAVLYEDVWHITTPHSPNIGAYHGTSADGLDFIVAEEFAVDAEVNWTGNLYTLENLVYFFGTADRGSNGRLWFSESTDMMTWAEPTSLDIPGGDPAAVYVQDQGWVMIYVGEPEDSE